MITAQDFYEKNKTLKWSADPIPPNLTTNLEKARWILNEAKIGWIELDIEFDLLSWQKEISTADYYKHRGDTHPGWHSCCLHGIDVDKTGAWTNYGYTKEEDVPYKWTSLSDSTPSIKDFWMKFPTDNYRRIRAMKLDANGFITPHSDMPGRLPGEVGIDMLDFGVPINIAVVHPDNCFMTVDSYGVVPFVEGKAFIVNIRQTHSVINLSDKNRIHIIGHSYGYGSKKEEFAKLVVRSYNKMLGAHN